MINKNNNVFLIQTRGLRDHVYQLREEKKIALQLYEHVYAIKNLSDSIASEQCNSILGDVEQLIAYFQKMADALLCIEQNAIQLNNNINKIIGDYKERVEFATSESFVNADF